MRIIQRLWNDRQGFDIFPHSLGDLNEALKVREVQGDGSATEKALAKDIEAEVIELAVGAAEGKQILVR